MVRNLDFIQNNRGGGGALGPQMHFSFYNNFIYLFIFGCVGSSLLPGLLSSCSGWGCSLVVAHGLLSAVASLAEEHRL